jgi:hypothetical protein
MVGLHVKGAKEEGPMASIGIDSRYGRPVVRLHRPEGGEIIISVMESGRAAINLVDEDGTERIVATSGDDFGEHFN